MALWVGTSGYNYPEWRGTFYPEKFPTAKMLPYYAERLSTVEINYTFYHLPTAKTLEGWKSATPENFKLTLKAPKLITHIAKLKDCAEITQKFISMGSTLGSRLGAFLFQLGPFYRKDVAVLESFLETLPAGYRAAFEFRHASWHDPEVYARLKARNAALCIADSEKLTTPVEITADFAYFRLRDEGYQPADIAKWAQTIKDSTAGSKDVYVYFKHEESGTGPAFARALLENLGNP